MAKLSKDEISMLSFNVWIGEDNKSNKIKSVIHFLVNTFYGLNTKEFVLTLTDKNLYIDYLEWPGQTNIAFTEIIDRKKIKSCEVRSDGNNEIITISKSKGKPMTFIRENNNSHNLASDMAKLITG